jgi:hypothetical protein
MATKEQIQVIIPTAVNTLCAVNETLISRKKAGMVTDISLPSLRRRALLIVKEVGVLSLQMTVPSEDSDFNR